jgi:hypothetical protein
MKTKLTYDLLENGMSRAQFIVAPPEISYRAALRSHFTLDHATYAVSDCPGSIFKHFVRECGKVCFHRGIWKPVQLENLLRMLDTDCSDVARWYALNVLLEHQVKVPLETD